MAELSLPFGPVTPSPSPPGWPGCAATVRYDGVSARLVRAFKDGDRRDLLDPLARLLAEAVDRSLAGLGGQGALPVVMVPVPSAPAAIRRRGDSPTVLLARRCEQLLGPGLVCLPVLRMARGTADQAGLGRGGRLANLEGAMRVTRPERVRGRCCVLVDDVLTSGATLSEGRRALLAAGAARVLLAVAMATPRRSPVRGLPFRAGAD